MLHRRTGSRAIRQSFGIGSVKARSFIVVSIWKKIKPRRRVADPDRGSPDYGPSLLFVEIIKSLLGDDPVTFSLEADIGVFAVAYDDVKNNRLQLNVVNMPPLPPSRPMPLIKVALCAPKGKKIKGLKQLPEGSPMKFTIDSQGVVHTEVRNLEHLCVIGAGLRIASICTLYGIAGVTHFDYRGGSDAQDQST